MNPQELLDLASDLATGTLEAEWRSTASRAYYAAFHAARQLFRGWGFSAPHADRAHAYLWFRLSNCGHSLVQQAGSDLGTLRSVRNRADYDLDQRFDDATAVREVQTALDVLQVLQQIPTVRATEQQIVWTIRTYERDVLGDVTWQAPIP